jgi:hypothetical protein
LIWVWTLYLAFQELFEVMILSWWWWIDFLKWLTLFHVVRLFMLPILLHCSWKKLCIYMAFHSPFYLTGMLNLSIIFGRLFGLS